MYITVVENNSSVDARLEFTTVQYNTVWNAKKRWPDFGIL